MESTDGIPEKQHNKKVRLNRLDIFVLAFGAMIGWGWVVLTGEWIASAGTLGSALAFLIGGIMVLFVGLVYAELASAMPRRKASCCLQSARSDGTPRSSAPGPSFWGLSR